MKAKSILPKKSIFVLFALSPFYLGCAIFLGAACLYMRLAGQ